MLQRFSFKNFRSFRDDTTLDMRAQKQKHSSVSKIPCAPEAVCRMFDTYEKFKVFPLAAIFGKNGSGKSNVLAAFQAAVDFICDGTPIMDPFAYDEVSADVPTEFYFEFYINKILYKYGFSVLRGHVVKEFLFYYPKNRERQVFTREGQDFHFTRSQKDKTNSIRASMTKESKLFLWIGSRTNHEICGTVMNWFLSIKNFKDYSNFWKVRDRLVADPNMLQKVNKLIDNLDARWPYDSVLPHLATQDTHSFRSTPPTLIAIRTFNSRRQEEYLAKGHKIVPYIKSYNLRLTSLSEGFKRLVCLAVAILDTLDTGSLLLIDDFDMLLHPYITYFLLYLINNDARTNPKDAQLICTIDVPSHAVNYGAIGSDQMYVVDVDDETGTSSIRSVHDFNFSPECKNEDVSRMITIGEFGSAPAVAFHLVFPEIPDITKEQEDESDGKSEG